MYEIDLGMVEAIILSFINWMTSTAFLVLMFLLGLYMFLCSRAVHPDTKARLSLKVAVISALELAIILITDRSPAMQFILAALMAVLFTTYLSRFVEADKEQCEHNNLMAEKLDKLTKTDGISQEDADFISSKADGSPVKRSELNLHL